VAARDSPPHDKTRAIPVGVATRKPQPALPGEEEHRKQDGGHKNLTLEMARRQLANFGNRKGAGVKPATSEGLATGYAPDLHKSRRGVAESAGWP